MRENPLLDKLREGRTALGLYANSTDMIDLCAHLGIDWVMLDQMFSAHDWGRMDELIRATEGAGMTPVVRVQSNPWLGYDHRIAVDVTRALGIGAQFVLVSHSGKQEIDECLEVAGDWHRKVLIIHPFSDFDDWAPGQERMKDEMFIIPQPESVGALETLDDVIRTPGVKLVFIAMTDASRVLTKSQKPDFYDKRLWDYIDRAVALGKEHGVWIGANTSYAYSLEEIAKRIGMLHSHGVRMIMAQGTNFLFQIAMQQFLKGVRPLIGE
jgi:4-hydroxy-2-oxoheptanedioate aldolase